MDVPYKLEMVALATILIKLGVSLYPYSGKNKPPMFGDYEAQRHWMEVTVNLPMKEWYVNTTENDLLYWGLDYPPLTAYHSYLVGQIGRRVNPAYVELTTSRGYESHDHQFFMRMSVLVSDLLIFLTALYYFVVHLDVPTRSKARWVVFALCCHPVLILIDYGHFQYNCVSLGLALWSVALLLSGRNVLAALAFSAALNFKQMELYHALPIFFYLLAMCRKQSGLPRQLFTLIKIGVATLAAFGLIWYPFLGDVALAQQVVHRVFPFQRGIFEDYVANFWCCLNVAVKLKRLMEPAVLAKACLAVTAVFSFPPAIHLYFKPSGRNLLLSLVNVSLAFFLFSYHVHEKSILLPALPVSLLAPYAPRAAFWFLSVAHFSCLPLYAKEDLVLPALAVLVLYCLLAHSSFRKDSDHISGMVKFLAICSALGCLVLAGVSLTIPPPSALPHLWTLLVSFWSFVHFSLFLAYYGYLQFVAGAQSLKMKSL